MRSAPAAVAVPDRLFLVGPMGAGKTTVGRHLAELLGFDFVDSDHEIESRTGVSIPWIFEKEGEAGFRQREQAMIDELTQRHHVVLATGGGAVMRDCNRHALHERGCVVYLETPVAMQLARTERDRNRPLLQTPNPAQKLAELMALRDPLYRSTAHHIVPTSEGAARDLALRIIQLVQRPQTR